jgi:hypothetical protein
MLKAFLSRQIDSFEKAWTYDASYMRELLDLSPWAYIQFGFVTALGRRREAPVEAMAAAGLVGTLSEDCGPCTQISADIAARSGVRPQVIRGVLAGDPEAMGPDAWLAYRFAKASLARDLMAADPLREEIVRRWGQKALVALGLTLTTARMYPTLKYALGHGRTCSRVMVEGTPVVHIERLAA